MMHLVNLFLPPYHPLSKFSHPLPFFHNNDQEDTFNIGLNIQDITTTLVSAPGSLLAGTMPTHLYN